MKPIRFAIIGAGNIGKIHVAALQQIPQAQVTVICNRSAERGRALATTCGAEWVADYTVAVARPDVDAVAVCTPSGLHGEVAVAAARAGKHLLVEKPIEVTLPAVDQIIQAAQAANVVLACVFPLRFAEGVHQAKAALAAGRLGQLALANVFVKWYRTQAYYDSGWRGTWTFDGGGALMNQAIHNIDLLQWLVGPVTSVFGQMATLAHERVEAEDTASAVLTFQNGGLGTIQGATSCWPGEPARIELHGDRGTIILEEGRIVTWKLADATPAEEQTMLTLETQLGSGAADPMAIGSERHRRQYVDMIEAIEQQRPPRIEGAEARRSVEIIRAIYHSAQEKRLVALPFAD